MPVLIVHASDEGVRSFWMWCPACDDAVRIVDGPNGWTWDGNTQAPTFSPSILCTGGAKNKRCHSFLRGGVWEFLSDCTHDHAGESMPMVPVPQWLEEE